MATTANPSDTPSTSAMAFLEAIQDAQSVLTKVWGQYSAQGASSIQRVLTLSGRPFAVTTGSTSQEFRGSLVLGLIVEGRDGRKYDLGVDLMWDGQSWTIDTEAWVSDEIRNQVLLRELPRRRTTDLAACLSALRGAVGDLASFQDLVFRE